MVASRKYIVYLNLKGGKKKFKKRLRFFFEQKKKTKRWATKLAGSGFSTVRQPTT
jgi:hypothetical protein